MTCFRLSIGPIDFTGLAIRWCVPLSRKFMLGNKREVARFPSFFHYDAQREIQQRIDPTEIN